MEHWHGDSDPKPKREKRKKHKTSIYRKFEVSKTMQLILTLKDRFCHVSYIMFFRSCVLGSHPKPVGRSQSQHRHASDDWTIKMPQLLGQQTCWWGSTDTWEDLTIVIITKLKLQHEGSSSYHWTSLRWQKLNPNTISFQSPAVFQF